VRCAARRKIIAFEVVRVMTQGERISAAIDGAALQARAVREALDQDHSIENSFTPIYAIAAAVSVGVISAASAMPNSTLSCCTFMLRPCCTA